MADIKTERERIVLTLKKRQDDLRNKIRKVEEDYEEALHNMEDAGTHDLRENSARKAAEIQCAKAIYEKQALVRMQETGMSYIDSYVPSDFVSIGSCVKIQDTDSGKIWFFMLVPPDAGEASIGAVSIDAPVGKAILSKCVGDQFIVLVASKCIHYKILELY